LLRFSPNLLRKYWRFFLKNQCYDPLFAEFSSVLNQKWHFRRFFVKNILKIIESFPEPSTGAGPDGGAHGRDRARRHLPERREALQGRPAAEAAWTDPAQHREAAAGELLSGIIKDASI
jgi:hypothetical protein